MRLILCIVGMAGVVWFVVPLLLTGSLNIGNVTGILLGGCLFLYGIGMKQINCFLAGVWKHSWGKIVFAIAGVIALAVILLTACATISMIKAANQKPGKNATLVVLGCRVYGERPSLMLQERLDAAYRYLTDNPDSMCVLSGGQGKGEDISEAECMYRYLTDRGITPERLLREEKSTSTRENLAFSGQMIEEHGLCQEIAIATNEFHQYRAGKIAREAGLDTGAVNGKTAWWLFPTYYVRELYGIVYEWAG